ncbi:Protein CBR-PASH-1 [Caenorhabditis briggsae]|uniref:Protein CBR-PASH-1 n=1 Tax=Caenorhabditis briggsae TaxID=6238 RepID=A8WKH6_CAEBR|nr:Protein CBR-PASH-1 [Caenorhabditis briggsae]CAP20971.2 Protein CBR-PASH-1 [Caenorhabditis briggsae]
MLRVYANRAVALVSVHPLKPVIMESESVGKYEEALIAEREAILRQLALLGSDSEDEEKDENEEQSEEPQNVKTEPCEIEPTTCSESVEDLNAVGPPDEKKVLDSCPQETDSFGLDEDNEVDVDEEEKPCSAEPPSTGTSSENSRSPPVPVEKVVLDRGPADRIDLDKNHPLPDGWTVITHFSGMPVYYHRFTRVVTHSRPYQVEGIVRDHDIPLPSIPCLYRQIMDEKQKNLENQSEMTEEEIQENLQLHESEKTMSPERYRLYCEGRFKFKKITSASFQVHRYTNPEEKLGAVQKKRLNSMLKKKGFELDYDQLKKNNTPGEVLLSSQSGACLIDLTPAQAKLGTKKGGPRKPYLLNPMGKTTVAVLNEFVQRLAKGTLVYEVEDTRNVSNPYQATAMLTMRISTLRELVGQCKESLLVLSEKADLTGNSQAALDPEFKRFSIGCGVGANKKTARLVAAKDALTKIIPKLRISKEHVCDGVLEERLQKGFEEEAAELFKQVKIDSSSVVSMCTRFAIPKPFNLLRDAVSRAVRWNGMELKTKKEMVGNGSQLSKVVLELGDMEAGAEAIGVKQATQLAAQLLLQKMHPELPTYGSFLTLYGRFEDKKQLDNARRQHEEVRYDVVRLQDTGNLLQPNTNVLDKLANEMRNISLIYPPRRYLYGLEPQSSGIKTKTETATTQTDIIDYQFMIQPHMVPVQPPYGLPIPPLLQPSMSSPAFVGAPPQDYYYYQQPFQNQRNPRKRGHPTTPPYPHPGPPPPPNV